MREKFGAAVALVAAVLIGNMIISAAGAGADLLPEGSIEGDVVDFLTDAPVADATISIPGYGLTTRSLPDGTFHFIPPDPPIPTLLPYTPILATASASGYGTWTVDNLPLYPDDTLVLHVELRLTAWTHTVVPADAVLAKSATPPSPVPPSATSTCTGWDDNLIPPESIRVHLSQDNVNKAYNFNFYVKHVLPSEWIPSWKPDALRAGAVAIKHFGWWRATAGNARTGGPGCYDVLDTTDDQVFDPTYSSKATDQAVMDTFSTLLFRSGAIFQTLYHPGQGDGCAHSMAGGLESMSQYGTQACAQQGKQWADIVQVFYLNTTWQSAIPHDSSDSYYGTDTSNNCDKYPEGQEPPHDSYGSFTDRDGNVIKLKLDYFVPGGAGSFPALILVHGGAWKSGCKANVYDLALLARDAGFITFSIDYRLACDFPDTAQPNDLIVKYCGWYFTATEHDPQGARAINDLKQAISWVRDHAGQKLGPGQSFNGKVAALGFSAGGNLVYMAGATGTEGGSQPDVVAGWSGLTELDGRDDGFDACHGSFDKSSSGTRCQDAINNYIHCALPCSATKRAASPWSNVPDMNSSLAFPPVFIANASDELVPQAQADDFVVRLIDIPVSPDRIQECIVTIKPHAHATFYSERYCDDDPTKTSVINRTFNWIHCYTGDPSKCPA